MTSSVHSYEFLLEWDHAGVTWYFSRFGQITVGGHTYTPRLVEVPTVGGIYIDRTYADWADASFKLDNLADDWGEDFFFTARDAEDDFEDDEVRFYALDRDVGTPEELFTGLIKRPKFSRQDFSCTFEATFPVDAIEIQVPAWVLGKHCIHFYNGSSIETAGGTIPSVPCGWTMATEGLNPAYPDAQAGSCDHGRTTPNGCAAHNNLARFGGVTHISKISNGEPNNTLDKEDVRDAVAPIVIGEGTFKIRPVIYRADLSENELIVNGIISSCHPGLPFDAAQFTADRFRLWGEVPATSIDIRLGDLDQGVPGDRTLYPEEAGHGLWCYFAARWAITPEQYDRASQDSLKRDIVVKIDGGRKTLRDGLGTENPVLATEDVIRDTVNGVGWPASRIDDASILAAASYVGTRFRGRFEFDRPAAFMDWLQEMLGTWHGYAFYEGGKLGFGAKRHDETAVAVFGTGGYPIEKIVEPDQKDFSELTTGALFKYRDRQRHGHKFPRRDPGAQLKGANGGLVKQQWEKFFLHGIYDETEAQISAAIWVREEINLDYFVPFRTPLPDWLEARAAGVRVGKVIRINDPGITDNATNYLFRVIGWVLDPATYEVVVQTQIYDGAVYAYNTDLLGDIIRDGAEPSTGGRPPDVENVSAVVVDVYTNPGDPANPDDDAREARIECSADYPDLSAKMTEDHDDGLATEYPVIGYQLFWRFTDEPALHYHRGPFVKYPETLGYLITPFHKKKDVEILFAAVGRNNATGQVGYILDPTRATYLAEDVDTTEPAIDVDDGSIFAADDLVRCEGEFMKVASVAGDTVTMVDSGGNRAPELGSTALDHALGIEIGVAVLSHPSVTVDFGAARHTLPQVTGVVARQRRRGVRVMWNNLPDYDTEHYLIYWSVDGSLDDADPFVTNWLTQDPTNPPAGVQWLKGGKRAHHLIPQEDIDAAYGGDATGVVVQVRVAAHIKHNYSSALSALAGAAHAAKPIYAPADPIASDVGEDAVVGSNQVKVTVPVYFDTTHDALAGHTADECQATEVGLVVQKYNKNTSSWEDRAPWTATVADATARFQLVSETLHKGSRWRIVKAFLKNDAGRRPSNVVDLEILVDGKQDYIGAITDLAIAAFGADETADSVELDARHSQPRISFTQPATPVALDFLEVQKKRDTATRWNRIPPIDLKAGEDDDGNPIDTPGVKIFRPSVQHPKNADMDFRCRLTASDGSKSAWATLAHTSSDESGGDAPIRDDANGPSYPTSGHIVRNHIIGDPSNATVDFVYTPYADGTDADNAFGAPDAGFGPVREITLVLQPRNAANTADVGRKIRHTVAADQDKGTLADPFEIHVPGLDPGQRYRLLEIRYANGAGEVVRTGSVDLVAGANSYQYDATAIAGGSITATQDDNRNSNTDVSITQPATPVLLQSATYEVSYDNGSTWKHRKTRHLLGKATRYSVAGALHILDSIQHRKNISQMKVRVVLTPFGATYETGDAIAAPNKALTTGAQSVADDGYLAGSNPATAPAAPTFIRGTIGNNGIHIRYSKPADARPFLQRLEVQIMDNSSNTLSIARDWLDADDGSIAVTGVAPSADPNATGVLAAATFPGSVEGKFHSSDVQFRDLDTTFTSNVSRGTLTLACRARYVDLDDSGVERTGSWSVITAMSRRSQQDLATDVLSDDHATGSDNPLEGFGCYTDAASYPSGSHGNGNTLGRKFYCAVGTVNPSDATNGEQTALDTFPGKKYSGGAWSNEAGNPWDTGNRGIYWNKSLACIEVYGQAGAIGNYHTSGGNIQAAASCKAPGIYYSGDVAWFCMAIASYSFSNLGSAIGLFVNMYDGAANIARGGGILATVTFPSNNWRLVAIKLQITSNFTSSQNIWLRILTPTFTQSTNHRLLIKNGIIRKGNVIPRLWVPGKEEGVLEANSGVSLSDSRGLANLYNAIGWGTDGLTSSGVLV